MVFKSFVGIDVSKLTLDVCVASAEDVHQGSHREFKNTQKGFEQLLKFVIKQGSELSSTLFCFENTGDYSLLLSHFLKEKGCGFHMANPMTISRSKGLLRAKTDKIDSKVLMEYAYKQRDFIELSELATAPLLQLRNLHTTRKRLVKEKTAQQQQIKLLEQTAEVIDNQFLLDLLEEKLEFLILQIKAVEKKIDQVIDEHPEIKKNVELIRSIPGVGPVLAVSLIITTKNFTSFTCGRKYASYCGVAPFPHSSGTSVRGRTKSSKICNREVKALLTNCVTSLINHDAGVKAYYKRKLEEGKKHFIVVNNIRAKLINRVFAVVKRDQNYVALNFA